MLSPTISLYRNAYGGLSANTWWLSLVMLINRSGTMVVPFMTMYMTQHIGVGIGKASFVMSLFGAGAIVGALVGGKLTDKIGFHYVQLVTLFGGGISFIVLGQMKTYPAICFFSFVLSIINEAFRPANAVAIAHYSEEKNRTRSYSLNRLAINLGWAFGGALGGIIATYNYELLFWVDGFTNIGAALLLYFVLSPPKNTHAGNKKAEQLVTGKTAYKDHAYLIFIGIQVLFAICFFQLFSTLPVFYKVKLHLSEFLIGMIMAYNGLLIALIEMIIIFKLEGRRPPLYYIAAGVLLIGISYLILNIGGMNAALLAFISATTFTVGEMLSLPFMNSYWIARTSSNNRGQYAALYTVSWSVAQATGPLFGGQIAEHAGYVVLWWVIGGLCILLSCTYGVLQIKR